MDDCVFFHDYNAVFNRMCFEIAVLKMPSSNNARVVTDAAVFIQNCYFDVAIFSHAYIRAAVLVVLYYFIGVLIKIRAHHIGIHQSASFINASSVSDN